MKTDNLQHAPEEMKQWLNMAGIKMLLIADEVSAHAGAVDSGILVLTPISYQNMVNMFLKREKARKDECP